MTDKQETQQVTQQEAEVPTIGLRDLVIAKEAIQVASSRGAFKAEEMSTVGATYDRLVSYIAYYAPKPEDESGEKKEEAGGAKPE